MPDCQPDVSVIIPAFNAGRYLGAALHSVLTQTHKAIEVIVVDDGSQDDTRAVACQFGGPVRYVAVPHGGAGAARNEGIARAQGRFVAFLDADDLWLPDKLALQLAALERAPSVDLLFGQIEHFFSPELDETARRSVRLPAGPMPGVLPSTLLARRSACQRVGPFETGLRVGEFISWFLRARELGIRSEVLPQLVARRRVHEANTARGTARHYTDYVRILKGALDRSRTRAAC